VAIESRVQYPFDGQLQLASIAQSYATAPILWQLSHYLGTSEHDFDDVQFDDRRSGLFVAQAVSCRATFARILEQNSESFA